ncbi:hypothetical protein CRG98_038059 [Punica granatum]|uniref:DWNN domain-containing protein n=1 Tax=Punica granatum TaxID=22663 RepID=A0A2I0IC21_PUNGR|nr:hypothetical protein CRG98_038059 [Punica granatum]
MKDAVLTSKCCFNSFCDKCIRDHIISKAMCVCGATNILADDLLPNKTLRDTINRILESGNSSAENAGSAFQVQDMESARGPQPKIPSPTLSSASKGNQQQLSTKIEENQDVNVAADEVKMSAAPQHMSDKGMNAKVPDVSEATRESMSVREVTSQGSAKVADEEVQQKVASGEAAKKKKKKKVRAPANDMQWRTPQDLAAENYMMPLGPSGFNPYWNGMQPGMDGFMGPYANAMPYNMGYGMGPLDMPFGVMPPQDPFASQAYMNMMPPVPQRDLAPFGMGMNMNGPRPPIMSREEFEARKADLRRKRENESRGERREMPRERDYGRDMGSAGDSSSFMKSKVQKSIVSAPSDHLHHRHRAERPSPDRSTDNLEPSHRGVKRKSSSERRDRERERGDHDYYESHHDHHHSRSEPSKRPPSADPAKPTPSSSAAAAAAAAAALDRKQKASVFSRISFPENEPTKKRKVSSSSSAEPPPVGGSGSHHHKASSASNGYYDDPKSSSVKPMSTSVSGSGGRKASSSQVDYESSDDERHFKRKPSRYEPSPPPQPADWEEEERRHSRGSRERDRERDRSSGHSKRR